MLRMQTDDLLLLLFIQEPFSFVHLKINSLILSSKRFDVQLCLLKYKLIASQFLTLMRVTKLFGFANLSVRFELRDLIDLLDCYC